MRGLGFPLLLIAAVLFPAAVPAAPSPMGSWLGNWAFSECWPDQGGGSNCIQYQLHISRAGDQVIADLDLDGFQTMSRIRGAVKPIDNGIQIVFVRIREPGLFDDTYKAGDVLLDLSRKDGKVLTTWIKMKPALDKNNAAAVHFEKVNK